jgi:hypothetical protein
MRYQDTFTNSARVRRRTYTSHKIHDGMALIQPGLDCPLAAGIATRGVTAAARAPAAQAPARHVPARLPVPAVAAGPPGRPPQAPRRRSAAPARLVPRPRRASAAPWTTAPQSAGDLRVPHPGRALSLGPLPVLLFPGEDSCHPERSTRRSAASGMTSRMANAAADSIPQSYHQLTILTTSAIRIIPV